MSDLLEAVQALTRPTVNKIIQDTADGGTKLVDVTHPALLAQLDEAIRSSMGGTTMGGSDPATRSLVDAGALMKMMQITSIVIDWARIHGATIEKASPALTLDRWYVAFNGKPHSDEIRAQHTRQLQKWEKQIQGLLDPPREKDLPDSCPLCGASEWWDPSTGAKHTRPLIIRYRPADEGMVKDATGHCRSCEKVWNARELAYEIERADNSRHAEENVSRSA